MRRTTRALLAAPALALALAATAAATGAAAQTQLKLIPQADLKSFDPVWNTAAITLNHAFMVYDTLFGLDANMQPKPQMVESYSVSPDGLTHKFTLRAGMKYHDGTPVTAKDVPPSLTRWSKKTTDGAALVSRAASMTATGELSFEIVLKEPFGPILDALSNPIQPPFIMREKDSSTDHNTQLTDAIGSGPFMFVKEEWKPGDKVLYRKNKDYKPRTEATDAYAGSKMPKVDEVLWTYIPDSQTATQAFLRGEADIFEIPPMDLLPLMKKDPNVTVEVFNKPGVHGMVRFNALHPPFNNAKARQAFMLAVDQKQYLAGMIGNPEYEKECYAVFQCGSPNETTVGSEMFQKRDLEKAKQLVKESGYDGRPIVVLDPTDQQIIHNISIMAAQTLKEIGMNVDLQATDWATVTTRRGQKAAPGQGSPGWNIFTTWSSSVIMQSPVTNFAMPTQCDGTNWFGWPCDEELEKLRKAYIPLTDPAARKAAIEAIQKRYYEVMPFAITGQFQSPVAYRKNITGMPKTLVVTHWNTEKK